MCVCLSTSIPAIFYTAPCLVEIQPSSPLQLSNEHHLLQARAGGGGGEGGGARVVGSDVRGGVAKGKGRRMKKSKLHTGVAATSARYTVMLYIYV